ncbi:MAG TPA: 2-oxo-4-hydroxy-4-carboxy-5-ureidoimidazoline decarboxylase [Thermoanaerobaculia bacterium]|nr:2-oxo-4-hydroxy-4-carboxy-5-ureidoimidazoline decarboxylase [Thermoanaerobaculia bacterium]
MPDFKDLPDLASERIGASVIEATDDFFAPKENLIKDSRPEYREGEFTDRGKWMDGWESRRKRTPGHDSAVVRLGAPGVIRGVIADTSFFRGNYPPYCSIHVLPSELAGDTENAFAVDSPWACTHVRLNIYPDGGVARLRVHGEVVPDWHRLGGLGQELDFAAIEHGGQVLECSDMFFGPKHNLILPGLARNMGDGWETRRRRGPGNDWVTVRLGAEATIRRVEIDTSFFKGNYPDACSIDGILPRTKMQPDTVHVFTDALTGHGPKEEIRLNVYPDGGIARLRVYGTATESGRWRAVARRINTRVPTEAEAELRSCCGSVDWVRGMMASRPFENDVATAAETIWWDLDPPDWQEAFAAHPRIGEAPDSAWSRQEQSGISSASGDARRALASVNAEYERKFGYRYIVCATGKSADEMLEIARRRLQNEPDRELRVAAEEQWKITMLRLMKLVA